MGGVDAERFVRLFLRGEHQPVDGNPNRFAAKEAVEDEPDMLALGAVSPRISPAWSTCSVR